jgi:poly(3-hydroxybutyrate) depolymerase
VPVTAVAGLLDRTVPYDGGRATLLAQPGWFDRIAAGYAGCSGTEEVGPISDHVVVRSGTVCSSCTSLLTIDDGTHTWPGSTEGVSGLIPGTYDLNGDLISSALSAEPSCLP